VDAALELPRRRNQQAKGFDADPLLVNAGDSLEMDSPAPGRASLRGNLSHQRGATVGARQALIANGQRRTALRAMLGNNR